MSAVRCVEIAGCIATERLVTSGRVMLPRRGSRQRGKTIGRVVESRRVCEECLHAGGRVLEAGDVADKRIDTGGRVLRAAGVADKGIDTDGRVVSAGGKTEERIITLRGITTRIAAVRGRDNRSHCGRKPKADEYERDEKKSEPHRRPVD